MCMSCGCKQPNENHGDQRNITMQDLQAAGQAADAGPEQIVRNIQQGFEEFGQGGQFASAGTRGRQTSGSQGGEFTGQGSSYGAGSDYQGGVQGAEQGRAQSGMQGTTGQQQRTGNNEQDYEKRQGGYGTGGSSSPQ
jgi:hypothetical protein